MYLTSSGSHPDCARILRTSPSSISTSALAAPLSDRAEWVRVWRTASRSNAERLMTFSTSAVAFCCSSASRVSLNSPTLLIAMTA